MSREALLSYLLLRPNNDVSIIATTGTRDLSNVCLRVTGIVAGSLRSVRIKALIGPASVMGRRVACYYFQDLLVSSVGVKKNLSQPVSILRAERVQRSVLLPRRRPQDPHLAAAQQQRRSTRPRYVYFDVSNRCGAIYPTALIFRLPTFVNVYYQHISLTVNGKHRDGTCMSKVPDP